MTDNPAMSTPEPRQSSFLPNGDQLALAFAEQGRLDGGAVAAVRGRGRPKGSQNRRQQDIAAYIVQRYGDPLDAMGNIMATPLETLVAVLRAADNPDRVDELERLEALVSRVAENMTAKDRDKIYSRLMRYMSARPIDAMEVANWWKSIVADLTTYVHGRKPQQVDFTVRPAAQIYMPGVNVPSGTSAAQVDQAMRLADASGVDITQAIEVVQESAEGGDV